LEKRDTLWSETKHSGAVFPEEKLETEMPQNWPWFFCGQLRYIGFSHGKIIPRKIFANKGVARGTGRSCTPLGKKCNLMYGPPTTPHDARLKNITNYGPEIFVGIGLAMESLMKFEMEKVPSSCCEKFSKKFICCAGIDCRR
jgi:hypothetical protein